MLILTVYVGSYQSALAYFKAYLPRPERILYYNSLIEPLILYCCNHDNVNKIFKLQKRYARLILDAQKRHSSIDLFNTLGWVPYYIESDIKRCSLAYKRIMGSRPDYIITTTTTTTTSLFTTVNYLKRIYKIKIINK